MMKNTKQPNARRQNGLLFGKSIMISMLVFTGCWGVAHADDSRLLDSQGSATTQIVDLSGEWRFEIDQEDKGEKDAWFKKDLLKKIKLPGSMSENGYGTYGSPGELGVGGWGGWKDDEMWHPVLKKDYRGSAWYQRDLEVPVSWESKHLRLFLERVCWVSELWIDGKKVGKQDSLVAPHLFEIGKLSSGKHRLTLRVDNRMLHYIGCNTHAYHEQSMTIFNGIVGRIELSARPMVFVTNNQVFSDPETGICRCRLTILNTSKTAIPCALSGSISGAIGKTSIIAQPGEQTVELTVNVPKNKVKPWGEFDNSMFTAQVRLKSKHGVDESSARFAFRSFDADGNRFLINGKPVMMRGEASNAMFPMTGYQPMTVAEWRKVFQVYKDYGINHFRCHSFTPPEAAFIAGDELGMFIQTELPNGENTTKDKIGNVWRRSEFYRILDTYGNHPSFALYSNGNEAKTGKVEFLLQLVREGKEYDPRHLYTNMSNAEASRNGDGYDCDDFTVSHRGAKGRRRLEWTLNRVTPNTMEDYRNTYARAIPYVSHEVGQWYVYPPIDTIDKYTGVVEPRNLIKFKELMTQNGLIEQAAEFQYASGRHSLLLYKEEIEHSLRTPQYGGFQLLALQDSYDQGSAFVGHIDNFFDAKNHVTAQEFKQFCGPEVPLARFAKRTWLNNETFTADIELANYGPHDLSNKPVSWTLTAADTVLAQGVFTSKSIPNTGLFQIGKVSCALNPLKKATKVVLTVKVDGTSITNDWELWVYPAELEMPKADNVIVTNILTDEIKKKLKNGARVVLLPSGYKSKYPTGMTPPFWSPMMFSNQKQTIGFVCQVEHPALNYFPTDIHNNWQWYDLTRGGSTIDLSSLGADFRPIVQGIDRPDRCLRLGIVYEGKVGKGRLLVSTLDLTSNLKKRPVARQLRYSLLRYAASHSFDPQIEITDLDTMLPTDAAVSILVSRGLVKNLSADSENENQSVDFAVDGNPDTFWNTPGPGAQGWDDTQTSHPHQLTVELKEPITIRGVKCTPRQGDSSGQIAKYNIYVSSNGKKWKNVATGTLKKHKWQKEVYFKQNIKVKFIKFEALSEIHGGSGTSLAEFDVIPAKN